MTGTGEGWRHWAGSNRYLGSYFDGKAGISLGKATRMKNLPNACDKCSLNGSRNRILLLVLEAKLRINDIGTQNTCLKSTTLISRWKSSNLH